MATLSICPKEQEANLEVASARDNNETKNH